MRCFKIFTVLFLSQLIYSCAGYWAISKMESSLDRKQIIKWIGDTSNKDSIISRYGKPNKIKIIKNHIKDKEIWTYRTGRIGARGVILLVGIPVPLLMPEIYDTNTFEFHGDKLHKHISLDFDVSSYVMCGIIPMGPHGVRLEIGCASYFKGTVMSDN